jgi:biopolymer transport protein ExbD
MAMSAGGGDDEPVSEINVTPMTDVLLCLLIIFMISAPTPSGEKIPLSVPKESQVQSPSDPNATLLVTVEADGSAKLGNEPLSSNYEEMVEQFKKNEKAVQDDKVVVSGNGKAKYGAVVRVMAAAHEAGIAEVGIASDRL